MGKKQKKKSGPKAIGQEKNNYSKDVKRWKDKRTEFEGKTKNDEGHTIDALKDLGRLKRAGQYRRNGYFHIKGKSARKLAYDKDGSGVILGQNLARVGKGASGGITAGSAAHGKRYEFVYSRDIALGKQHNFFCSYMPYRNEAHHLLPDSAFSDPNFTDDHRRILKKLPYDLNHGQNIIFLPNKLRDTPIHNLPEHNGNHPAYTSLVTKDLLLLRGKLGKFKKKPCDPDEPPGIGIMDNIIDSQQDYWDLLVKLGAGNINRLAKAHAANVGK